MKSLIVFSFLVFMLFVLSGCAPGQVLGPTITPSPTTTNTPTISPTSIPTTTSTQTPTNTPTVTPTPTPIPICKPNNTILGSINTDIPGYIDLVQASTKLEGNDFSVTFTLREIPAEITINNKNLKDGQPEIAWGVAIDKDNNPDTGSQAFAIYTGYGYDLLFQAFNIKFRSERTGSIENLFRGSTYIWNVKDEKGSISSGAPGKIMVNQEAKTITLNAKIPGMTPDSYLYFYAFAPGEKRIIDDLCVR